MKWFYFFFYFLRFVGSINIPTNIKIKSRHFSLFFFFFFFLSYFLFVSSSTRNNALLAVGGLSGGLLFYLFGYKKLKEETKKLKLENRDLLEFIKLQTELNQLQQEGLKEQLKDLEKSYQELYQDLLERDYEEFKAPDTNGDNIVTREEVSFSNSLYLSYTHSFFFQSIYSILINSLSLL